MFHTHSLEVRIYNKDFDKFSILAIDLLENPKKSNVTLDITEKLEIARNSAIEILHSLNF